MWRLNYVACVKVEIALACAMLLFACCQGERQEETPGPEVPASNAHAGLHKLTIRGTAVYVDIADNSDSRARGLMFRDEMPEDEGMLFIYAEPGKRWFWMEDTYIRLSLAYIDENGKIFQLVDMEPLDKTTQPSQRLAQYVLEVNQGWFRKHGIKVGDIVGNLPSPEGAEK
jgi:uncharacterized membrane protein (UPF0127 family)